MRFFALSNLQDIVLYLFPALIVALIFGLALSFAHFRMDRSGKQEGERSFPKGIKEKSGPFPAVLVFIIAGTVLWVFFYILFTGLLEVTI